MLVNTSTFNYSTAQDEVKKIHSVFKVPGYLATMLTPQEHNFLASKWINYWSPIYSTPFYLGSHSDSHGIISFLGVSRLLIDPSYYLFSRIGNWSWEGVTFFENMAYPVLDAFNAFTPMEPRR